MVQNRTGFWRSNIHIDDIIVCMMTKRMLVVYCKYYIIRSYDNLNSSTIQPRTFLPVFWCMNDHCQLCIWDSLHEPNFKSSLCHMKKAHNWLIVCCHAVSVLSWKYQWHVGDMWAMCQIFWLILAILKKYYLLITIYEIRTNDLNMLGCTKNWSLQFVVHFWAF